MTTPRIGPIIGGEDPLGISPPFIPPTPPPSPQFTGDAFGALIASQIAGYPIVNYEDTGDGVPTLPAGWYPEPTVSAYLTPTLPNHIAVSNNMTVRMECKI